MLGRPVIIDPLFMKGVCRIVINLLGPHRAYNAAFVHDATDLREQFANHLARLAESPKTVCRSEANKLLTLELRDLLALRERFRHGLSGHLSQLGLIVEGLEV